MIPPRYPLKECDDERYRVRTEQNVLDSDGTLILMLGRLSGGTALTARLVKKHQRPLCLYNLSQSSRLEPVLGWIDTHAIRVLNVAGPRESQQPGIGSRAYALLANMLDCEPPPGRKSHPGGVKARSAPVITGR